MFQVEKRDGTIAEFQMKKITDAIGKAFGAKDMQFSDDMLQMLALSGLSVQDQRRKNFSGGNSGQRGERADPVRLRRSGKSLHSVPQAEGKNPQHEIDDCRLQRDRGQLRKSRGLACQREFDRNVFCRRSDLKQFRRDHSQLLVIRDL